jgi:hypothetical protein
MNRDIFLVYLLHRKLLLLEHKVGFLYGFVSAFCQVPGGTSAWMVLSKWRKFSAVSATRGFAPPAGAAGRS